MVENHIENIIINMYLEPDDIYKIIILLNAQNKGWKIGYFDSKTFYLIKQKNESEKNSFINELIQISKKPLNLQKVFNELNNKKNL
jgi:hypothetical protein